MTTPQSINARDLAGRQFRYFDFVMVAFVVILLLSNVIGAEKRSVINLPWIGLWPFGAGILFFPISYVFGDILTEVYGYARARRVIWTGFAAMVFASFMAFVVVSLPPAAGWNNQAAYEIAFGSTWRIVAASLAAYCVGEFVNSFVLAKLKLLTEGRHLWMRTIGSTVFGEAIDSMMFYPLAFWNSGLIPNELIPSLMLSQWIAKTAVEILFTPITYQVIGFLKRAEQEDYFDHDTDFTPFRIKT